MVIKSPEKKYKSHNHRVYSCQYHVIFCPKYRRPVLIEEISQRLKEILLETGEMYDFEIIEQEIMPDHVHLLISCDPEMGISNCIKKMKSRSSHMLREEFPELKSKLPCLWTRSYFVSTVGSVSLDIVKSYIQNQKKV